MSPPTKPLLTEPAPIPPCCLRPSAYDPTHVFAPCARHAAMTPRERRADYERLAGR